MSNYNIIKTLNLSKEQRKRFNKALSESGSGSGNGSGNASNDEYDIYLQVTNPLLVDYYVNGIYVNENPNFDIDLVNKDDCMIQLDQNFKKGDILNIYINDVYIKKLACYEINLMGISLLMGFDYEDDKFNAINIYNKNQPIFKNGFDSVNPQTIDYITPNIAMIYGNLMGEKLSVITLTYVLNLNYGVGTDYGFENVYQIIRKLQDDSLCSIDSLVPIIIGSSGGTFRKGASTIDSTNSNIIYIDTFYEEPNYKFYAYGRYSLESNGVLRKIDFKSYNINKKYFDNLESRIVALEEALVSNNPTE